jgi:hypothetical protein
MGINEGALQKWAAAMLSVVRLVVASEAGPKAAPVLLLLQGLLRPWLQDFYENDRGWLGALTTEDGGTV